MSTNTSAFTAAGALSPMLGRFGRGLGYYLLKYVFPVVYALTVMPFVVSFYRHVVSPPNSDVMLLGLIPLGPVHTFFLPFFLLATEIISLRLAAAFWASRKREQAALLLVIFTLFQMFPAFSVFFDARVKEFQQLQDVQAQELRVDPAEERAADKLYADTVGQYTLALKNWNDDKDRIAGQIASTRGDLDTVLAQRQDALARLRAPGTLAERETATNENQRLAGTSDQLARQVNGLQEQLRNIIAAPPTRPERQSPAAKPQPLLYKTDVDYVVGTLGDVNSHLAMFVASMFIAIVFGAGYVMAGAEGNNGLARGVMSPLDIGRELRFCSGLPIERQKNFVGQIQSTINYQLAAHRALTNQSIALATLQMIGDSEVDEIRLLASFGEAVTSSGISPETKEVLRDFIDGLIRNPQPREPFDAAKQ